MSRSLRRGALAAALTLASLPLAAACAAGTDADTLQIKPDNATTDLGALRIQNVAVVVGEDGTAAVTGSITNTGAEPAVLESITLDGAATPVQLLPAADESGATATEVTVAPNGQVQFGGEGNAQALAPAGTAVEPGSFHDVTFRFAEQGETMLQAAVYEGEGLYADVAPTPTASPTASPAASPAASTSPAAGESAEAGEGAADQAGASASASASSSASSSASGAASDAEGAEAGH
ncbi:DUF461 domain-containing protein [Allostreptomyces psammosilenae]|uniref:DUF461 domain-containing protein n=1 Tax=Allostreptomyces psammosilenae TaxID=1892865 RepID=A0A853A0B4_9ACTN|nr:DUF461 domain-containing protein [Allostreptomyces psammosilenae]NYI07557.1 hypothetical protein [Allostreptomyces psammosilenae]